MNKELLIQAALAVSPGIVAQMPDHTFEDVARACLIFGLEFVRLLEEELPHLIQEKQPDRQDKFDF